MKKKCLFLSLLLTMVLITGCKTKKEQKTEDPIPQPTTAVTQEPISPTTVAENTKEEDLTVKDFYPTLKDTVYVYEGVGNEYAGFRYAMDFYDQKTGRFQVRKDTGGTTVAEVLEIKDGKLSEIFSMEEVYYIENRLQVKATDKAEVILMEPLKKGTSWTLPNKQKRYISGEKVAIETPLGKYDTIEVTTEGEDGTTKNYYAAGIGLVKTITSGDGYEVSATLSEIIKDSPFTSKVNFYYPNEDEKIYETQKKLTFPTNEDPIRILEKAMKEKEKDGWKLISENTKVNSLYLGKDNVVYVDFSKEFVTEMNLGSGYEGLALQCIANTLGGYYGAREVNIKVDKKNYEGGHIEMEDGENLKVDLNDVIR